jgi:hypothetical protein
MRLCPLPLLLALLAACVAQEPEPPFPPSAREDRAALPEGPFIQLRLVPYVVESRTVPLRGRGPRNGSVVVFRADSPDQKIRARIGADSIFCIDLPLLESGPSTFTVRTSTQGGAESQPRIVVVEQQAPAGNAVSGPTCLDRAGL